MSDSTDTMACSNCATPYGPADVFCENCGLDFLSGSLPEPLEAPVVKPSDVLGDADADSSSATRPDTAAAVLLTLRVEVDAAFHTLMAPGGEVALPDPLPDPTTVELRTGEVLIGRTSDSRNVHPEIDVQALTGDPAASTRHAVLHRNADATWTVRDLDSTNGTYVGEPDKQITAGIATAVEPGTTIYVGAYTKLTLR